MQVQVVNGNGRLLDAETATDQLRQKGYDAVSGGNADSFGKPETVVAYAEGQREAAKNIATLFGPSAVVAALPRASTPDGVDVRVTVGESYDGQLVAPRKKKAQPKPVARVVDTRSLIPLSRRIQKATGLKIMVPTRVPTGSELKVVRAYRRLRSIGRS